jgi:hypothetical protein
MVLVAASLLFYFWRKGWILQGKDDSDEPEKSLEK